MADSVKDIVRQAAPDILHRGERTLNVDMWVVADG